MSLPAKPFGFKPYGGKQMRTLQVTLIAANAAIGRYDPIYALADGCDLMDDAISGSATQLRLIGIAMYPVEASAGGKLDCWAWDYDQIFMAQASTVASTTGLDTEAHAQNQPLNINPTTRDTTFKTSKMSVVLQATTAYAPAMCRGYAPIPGNTVGATDSYPILLVCANREGTTSLFGAIT
jgi:hypothetical protein